LIEGHGLDEDGYIRIDGSLSKITARFRALVETVQCAIVASFEAQVHSLYVYGSVASGQAKPITSDLDILIVFNGDPSLQVRRTLTQLEGKLSQDFRADVREVGLEATSIAEVFEGDNPVGWGCFIKHLCVCLAGDDLGERFPKFKPTKAVAYGLNGDVQEEIERAKRVLQDSSARDTDRTIRTISRKMVRTAFCLTMEEANCWTGNLDECASIFSEYYPEWAAQIEDVLRISKGAPASSDECLNQLDGFGQWLCVEVQTKLRSV